MTTTKLKDHKDFTGNNRLVTLCALKAKLKTQLEALLSQQKQADDEIKAILGDHASFECDGYYGTFKFEPRAAYEVKASSPRVLRVQKP